MDELSPQKLFAQLPAQVDIYEVGPRDGLQNEKIVLPTEVKRALIEGLVDAGVRRVEMTSFVSPRWVPAMADHTELSRQVTRASGVTYSALVPNMRGLDAATGAGVEEVAVFMAASEAHNQKNINKSTQAALDGYAQVVRDAVARGMRVRGYVSCVWGCPYQGTVPVDEVIRVTRALLELGCYEVSLGDTIGVGTPRAVATVLGALFDAGVARDQLAVHFHDTRGTALANITVALQLGIATVDSAIGGIGGCPYAPGASGNVATEDVVYMLEGMGVSTGVSIDRLVALNTMLAEHLGRELPSRYAQAHIASCARRGVGGAEA